MPSFWEAIDEAFDLLDEHNLLSDTEVEEGTRKDV
jgi:hypothetical protein